MGASHRNDSTLGGLKIGQSENELLGQFDEKRKQLNLEVSVDADFISRDERQFRLYPLSCEIGLSAEILGFQRQFNILPTYAAYTLPVQLRGAASIGTMRAMAAIASSSVAAAKAIV